MGGKKDEKQTTWFNESPKKLHQSKISGEIKDQIRTLSMITGESVSNLTERILGEYISSKSDIIRKYHHERSREVR